MWVTIVLVVIPPYPPKRDVWGACGTQVGPLGILFPLLPTLGAWRRQLVLESNKIGDAGAAKLAAAMPSMPNLVNLDLSFNKMGDAGAEEVAGAMPSMPKLETLFLRINKIGDAGAEKIAAALPSMPSLKDPL